MSQHQTILVTGGCGFIGSHTVLELLNLGYEVIVLDNLVNSSVESLKRVEELTKKHPKFYQIDLATQKDQIEHVFSKHKVHAVIHFAGLKAVGESMKLPLKYFSNNLASTINLLEVMEKHDVRNIVFSSSATVYGDPEGLPVKETAPLKRPTNPYGRTKFFIEEIFRDMYAADQRWNIVLLRYFNPVGAHVSGRIGEDPQGVPNNLMPFVAQVAVGRLAKLKVFGGDYKTKDGTGVRDFLHVTDLALGHTASIKKILHEHVGCRVYNLGTGHGYSVLDMVNAMKKASGRDIPYEIVERRAGDVAEIYADATLAYQELGWKATRTLDDMCVDLWRWQSANPQGFAKM